MSFNSPSFEATKNHLFPDEVEIYLTFFHSSSSLSLSDIQSLVDKELESVVGSTDDAEESLYDESTLPSTETDIKLEGKALHCFEHLTYRASAFGEFYPFYFENQRIFKVEERTEKQNLYLFLLQCSSLNLVDRPTSQRLANNFEDVCKVALEAWIPTSEVKSFGPTSDDRRDYFGTDTKDALVMLGQFLDVKADKNTIRKRRCDGTYQVSSSGDKGLDLVAKIPFIGDGALGSFAIFGQCASRKEHWWHKKHEADPIEFLSYLAFKNMPINMVFVPVCYRDYNGDWYDEGKAGGCLFVDRLRICLMLNGLTDEFTFVPDLLIA